MKNYILIKFTFFIISLQLVSLKLYSQTIPIEFGECIQSTLETSATVKSFLLEEVESGDVIIVRAAEISGLVRPCVKAYLNNDFLNPIAEDCGNNFSAFFEFTASETGIYTVTVEDFFTDNAGAFDIYIQKGNQPHNTPEFICGNSTISELTCESSMATFFIEAEANSSIIATVSEESGLVRPCIQARNTMGEVLAEQCEHSFNAQIQVSVPEQGCIYFFIYDFFSDNNGEISININAPSGGCISPANCSVVIGEICSNGIDDDGDNLIDCDDPGCIPTITSIASTNPTAPNFNNGTITINTIGSNLSYSINDGMSFQDSNIFSGLEPGNYNIQVQNASSCTATHEENPFVLGAENIPCEAPVFSWVDSPDSVCPDSPFNLSGISNNSNFDIELYQDDMATGLLITGTGNDIEFSPVSISEPTTFSVVATLKTDSTCIFDIEDTRTVDIGSLDLTYETVQETDFNNDGAIDICINGGTAPYDIFHEPDRGSVEEVTGFCDYDLSIDALKAGYYVIEIEDANGCTGIEIIKVDNPDKRRIGFPEKPVLTPNGDGKNDELVFDGLFLFPESNELIIYDRFGGVLFQQENYLNTWDATYQGTPVPADTYFYALRVFMENEEELYRGYITIIR